MSSDDQALLLRLLDAKTTAEIDAVLSQAPDASALLTRLDSSKLYNYTAPNFFASQGNFDLATHCVTKHGYNPNTRDGNGRNILFEAVRNGRTGSLSFVKDMIDLYKVDVNHVDEFGDTPLHWACQNQSIDVPAIDFVHLLIEKGAKIDFVANNGKTPFLTAVAFAGAGLKAAQKLFSVQPALVEAIDVDGTNALIHACHGSSRYDVVEWLLSLEKFDVNYANAQGVTALSQLFGFGASEDCIEAAELLLAKGAKAPADAKGKTLIHKAAGFGSGKLNLLKFIVEKIDSDVNVVDLLGRTPLHDACDFGTGSPDVIEFLLSKGANVNASDLEGNTPLHIFVENFESIGSSAKKALAVLVKGGVDMNITNNSGLSALDIAELSQQKAANLLKGLPVEDDSGDDDEDSWDNDDNLFDLNLSSDDDAEEEAALKKLQDFSWD